MSEVNNKIVGEPYDVARGFDDPCPVQCRILLCDGTHPRQRRCGDVPATADLGSRCQRPRGAYQRGDRRRDRRRRHVADPGDHPLPHGRRIERFLQFMEGSPEQPDRGPGDRQVSSCLETGLGATLSAINALADKVLDLDNCADSPISSPTSEPYQLTTNSAPARLRVGFFRYHLSLNLLLTSELGVDHATPNWIRTSRRPEQEQWRTNREDAHNAQKPEIACFQGWRTSGLLQRPPVISISQFKAMPITYRHRRNRNDDLNRSDQDRSPGCPVAVRAADPGSAPGGDAAIV